MARIAGGWATRATWSVLLILVLLRAVTAFLPSMWAWGVNLQRFLAPIPAWLPWALTAATLHPAIAARIERRLDHVGDGWLRGRRRWLVGLAAGALVWSLPDRTWMTGDFFIREAASWSGGRIISFTEALPLERLLFRDIPRLFTALSSVEPNVVPRAIGALAAGALAVTALTIAADWTLKGSAALVAAATIFFGGYLCAFTGLGKPAALVGLLTAVALLGAMRLAREGRGGGLLGTSVGIALLVHRSALTLIPVWAVAVAIAFRRRAPDQPPGRSRWLALLPPLVCGLPVAPIVWEIVLRYDLPYHVAPADLASPGILGAAFAPLHLADLANLLLFFSPVLPIAAGVVLSTGVRRPFTSDGLLAALLALVFVPVLLLVHPRQGIFRDLEVFAPAGVAIALLGARAIGRCLPANRLHPVIVPALLAAVAMPAFQVLMLFHDPAAGFARTRSFATEAPTRPDRELGQVWDFLAYRAFRLGDWDRAVEASAQSVRYAPHPRALLMYAIARTYVGDHLGAESLYVALAERTPDDPLVWVGLGGAAQRVGDRVQTARALGRLNAYAPDGREARAIRRHLQIFPEVWPTARPDPGGEADGTRR